MRSSPGWTRAPPEPPASRSPPGCATRSRSAGGDELAGWQRRLVFSDALARAELARHGAALLAPTALHQLTLARGDVLSIEARVSTVLLAVIGLLAAANRRFVPVDEPKWLRWQTAGI